MTPPSFPNFDDHSFFQSFTPPPKIRVTYRDGIMHRVFYNILVGDSLSLVGVGSVGKTHLLKRFSTDTDVQDHYLHKVGGELKREDIIFIRVDPNALVDIPTAEGSFSPAWSGYEIILSRLLVALQKETNPALGQAIEKNYLALCNPASLGTMMAFRHLESAIRKVFYSENGKKRLVIVIDEFEEIMSRMPATFFRNMRSLRDEFRYKLLFITASRLEIESLVPAKDIEQLESFVELFQHPRYIGPIENPEDQQQMIEEFVERKRGGNKIPADQIKRLLYVTGGYGGLFRTCLNRLDDLIAKVTDPTQLVKDLLQDNSVLNECEIMLRSFSVQEQALLANILKTPQAQVNAFPGSEYFILTLRFKHILVLQQNGLLAISPPLLAEYLAKFGTTPRPRAHNIPNSSRPRSVPGL